MYRRFIDKLREQLDKKLTLKSVKAYELRVKRLKKA